MSIVAQGISRLNCVCRWTNGFCISLKPRIHIFAGEKVCIQAMRPTQFGAAFASLISCEIPSAVVNTGLKTMSIGSWFESFSPSTMRPESSATCRSTFSPYSPWLPVMNQASVNSYGFLKTPPPGVVSIDRKHFGSGRINCRYLPEKLAADLQAGKPET